MNQSRRVKVSKYLSLHLRHKPERLGLELAEGGWVRIDELLAACARNRFAAPRNRFALTRAELDEVVSTSDKQRFSFDPTGTLIRANQGHSVEVDLQLEPATPPAVLYHGTAAHNLESIRAAGLHKGGRHHVHLSPDVETARKVGQRHGEPVVLAIDAAAMSRDGCVFYRSANGVWLVDAVPPRYLRPL
jgi:putative RNA 2'-phosphotransferase